MENQLPLYLEQHLQDIGLFSKEHEELDDPVNDSLKDYRFNGPVGTFDEFGEPEW